ncbi:MAG: YkgJ family cysteine cluster protein [Pseudomonadota bacterium]
MNKYLQEITGSLVNKTVVTISARDVEQVITRLRELGATWKPVKGAARMSDRVTLRYRTVCSGRTLEDTSARPVDIVLGERTLPRAIEHRLAGLKPGAVLEHAVMRSARVDNQTVRQRIRYSVEIIKIARNTGPITDRQLARQFGISPRDPALLRKHIRQTIGERIELLVKRQVKQQVFSRLIEVHRKQNPVSGENDSGEDEQSLLEPILSEIVRSGDITLDYGRVESAVEALVSESHKPDADYRRYINNTKKRSQLESAILEDQVIEYLLDLARVDTINKRYADFMAESDSMTADRQSAAARWPVIQITPATKCGYCTNSQCCTYITQSLPTPRSKSDFSNLLWQVSHEGVRAFKDSEGWYLLIDNRCSHLHPNGRCAIYASRPDICRNHTNDYCEFEDSTDEGYDLLFNNFEELLAYCQKRFKRWDNYPAGQNG